MLLDAFAFGREFFGFAFEVSSELVDTATGSGLSVAETMVRRSERPFFEMTRVLLPGLKSLTRIPDSDVFCSIQ